MNNRSTPVTQVQAAPQRNQNRARGISSGTTFFLVSPSMVAAKGPLTQLKKYSIPIQTIPATMCSQRNSAFRMSKVCPPSACRERSTESQRAKRSTARRGENRDFAPGSERRARAGDRADEVAGGEAPQA